MPEIKNPSDNPQFQGRPKPFDPSVGGTITSPPGFFESLALGAETASITGAAIEGITERTSDIIADDEEVDPDWDALRFIENNPDIVRTHPWLNDVETLAEAAHTPNPRSFQRWLSRRQEDFKDRKRLSRGRNFWTNTVPFFVGAIGPDIAATAGAGVGARAVTAGARVASGLRMSAKTSRLWARGTRIAAEGSEQTARQAARKLAQRNLTNSIQRWTTNLDAATKLGKAAQLGGRTAAFSAAGAAGAAGEELAIHTLDPSRVTDAGEEAAQAALWGAAIMAPMPALFKAGGALMSFRKKDQIHADVTTTIESRRGRSNPEGSKEREVDDALQALDSLVSDGRLAPADGNATEAAVSGATAPLPAGRLERAPEGVRAVARTLFEFAGLTRKQADDPVKTPGLTSAESLQGALRAAGRNRTVQELEDALNGHFAKSSEPIVYEKADGETLTITSPRDDRAFGLALVDFWRRQQRGESPSAPSSAISQGVAALRRWNERELQKNEDAGLLRGRETLERLKAERARKQEALKQAEQREANQEASAAASRTDAGATQREPQSTTIRREISELTNEIARLDQQIKTGTGRLRRRWLAGEIAQRGDEFVTRLARAFRNARERLPSSIRPIDLDAARLIDDDAARRLIFEQIEEQTDAALRAADERAFDLYTQQLDRAARERAESVRRTIVSDDGGAGVEDAFSFARGQPLKTNEIGEIDELELDDFLESDPFSLIDWYDQQVGPNQAIQTAARMNRNELAPLASKLLDERLEGSPRQLARIADAQLREIEDQAKRVDGADGLLGRQAREMREQLNRILDEKITELTGRPVFPNNTAAEAGFSAAGNIALRAPTTAWLGNVGISSISDIAATAVFMANPQRIGFTIKNLVPFKNVPIRGLEAIDVAYKNDFGQEQRLLDSPGTSTDTFLSRTAAGRGLKATDEVSKRATNAFFKATGLQAINRKMRRISSHLVLQEVIEGARRMEKAKTRIDAGDSQDAAIRNAGLSKEDAARLNRLGLTGERSTRLLNTLQGRALDYNGEIISDIRKHRGQVSPEYWKWIDEDRELFNILTAGVNSEVRNIITDPKLLSRPLMNNRWLGKAVNQFQSFAFGWTAQTARIVSQRPMSQQMAYASIAAGLGALANAAHDKVTGRRDIEDIITNWQTNPFGEARAAVQRSPLLGWLARPVGLANNSDFGVRALIGNPTRAATQTRHVQDAVDAVGPLADYASDLIEHGARPLFSSKGFSKRDAEQIGKLIWFQNVLPLGIGQAVANDAGLVGSGTTGETIGRKIQEATQ